MNEGHEYLDELTESVVAGLVEAAAGVRVPDAALVTVRGADRPASGPVVGELWRAGLPGGGRVNVVWVRSVRSTEVGVVPVSFDVELADDATLIVPGDESPLGLPLAIHAGLEATIDRETLPRSVDPSRHLDPGSGVRAGHRVTARRADRVPRGSR